MLDLALPPLALALLDALHARRVGVTADADMLSALLTERGYPAHPSVLAFEESYGGLLIDESDPSVPSLLVGAYACHSRGPYRSAEMHLVPVMFSIDDVVYSLDAEGRGWACAAMVEGVSRRAARDGRQLLTQAILWRALANHARSYDALEGRHGGARAGDLGLERIEEASCRHERWWGTADRLVVEIERGNGYPAPMTYVAR